MKSILTPLSFLLLTQATAQTIQYSDLSPYGVQADMQYLNADDLPALADGTGQTWDLSGLTLQNVGTLAFSPAAGTPYAGNYPVANWAWAQHITGLGSTYQYLAITANGIDLLARNVPGDAVEYTDAARIMQFPLAFGEGFTDAYVHATGSDTLVWTYAGHGTLITPMGTFTDVAKLVNDEGEVACWNRNPLYPVMVQDDDDILFFVQNNVGVAEQEPAMAHTWPNPCHDRLQVEHALPTTAWRVLDAQGRVLLTGTFGPAGQVDVRSLAAGSYSLVLLNGSGHMPLRFIKE